MLDEEESELITACEEGDYDTVRLLVENGVDIEEKVYGITALMTAALKGYLNIVKILVEHGANVNVRGPGNNTALLGARTHDKVIKYLVKRGADVNVHEMFGNSPLKQAIYFNKYNIVKFLVENGADIYLKSNDGGNYVSSNNNAIQYAEKTLPGIIERGTKAEKIKANKIWKFLMKENLMLMSRITNPDTFRTVFSYVV